MEPIKCPNWGGIFYVHHILRDDIRREHQIALLVEMEHNHSPDVQVMSVKREPLQIVLDEMLNSAVIQDHHLKLFFMRDRKERLQKIKV